MKKSMFNDEFGLTQAVLDGIKTMKRCPVSERLLQDAQVFSGGDIERRNQYLLAHAPFKVGDVVAIAQNYKDCWDYYQKQWKNKRNPSDWHTPDALLGDAVQETAGWTNKLFVKADLMTHRIRITGTKVENMQDISNVDCRKEGIIHVVWRQWLKPAPAISARSRTKTTTSGHCPSLRRA